MSGLAAGIDTVAHKTAILNNGKTIAEIGTPLNYVYPRENAVLQDYIAKQHLLITQVPFIRYKSQHYKPRLRIREWVLKVLGLSPKGSEPFSSSFYQGYF